MEELYHHGPRNGSLVVLRARLRHPVRRRSRVGSRERLAQNAFDLRLAVPAREEGDHVLVQADSLPARPFGE